MNFSFYSLFLGILIWLTRPFLFLIALFNYLFIFISLKIILQAAMGTKLSVVESNLVGAYKEIEIFELLLRIYPQDFVVGAISNFEKYFVNGRQF